VWQPGRQTAIADQIGRRKAIQNQHRVDIALFARFAARAAALYPAQTILSPNAASTAPQNAAFHASKSTAAPVSASVSKFIVTASLQSLSRPCANPGYLTYDIPRRL
jgi:hypothetical protein